MCSLSNGPSAVHSLKADQILHITLGMQVIHLSGRNKKRIFNICWNICWITSLAIKIGLALFTHYMPTTENNYHVFFWLDQISNITSIISLVFLGLAFRKEEKESRKQES